MTIENRYRLGIDQIRKYLPHRAPFLLIDRVLEIHPSGDLSDRRSNSSKEGTRVVALKNVTYNEPFFMGHFPGFAVMPGVLITEAMAQAAIFSLYPYFESAIEELSRDFKCILLGINDGRFRGPVGPGDTRRGESFVKKCRGKLWVFDVKATVEGKTVAEAELMAHLVYKGGDAT